ncbi:LacI family DNA-binding transcriptional regulator [Cellulomonas aerilata]|uniref:LacI family transcriptional regulator n=1 Tax=Cellulomonas aerilata TaxID=515326 RepID=A0A512D983_9CELL|nr:LacI family DNA-binding transcriptional regulator [Cellulomonas aerilata]GEO32965.1 LacI family transcriptional regulator [Cellulomonas aerilata]
MTTIHDVARVAGVSISTVSYALSGKRSVSASTRQRIQDAVRELDYRPNAGARMLAGRRTYILAVTEPLRADTYAPAHMAFVLAVTRAARRHDYDVLLLTQDEASGGLQRVTSSRLVDAIVVLDVLTHDERADIVRALDIPAVLVGVPADTSGLVCVDLDFAQVARMAVDRLVEAGHTTVGLLGHQSSAYDGGSNFPPRLRDAFLAHAAERGVVGRFAMPERDPGQVGSAVDELLGPDADLTGLVMHCEEPLQVRALAALRARGLRVPQDVSVISAASTFDTSMFTPPLDSIPLVADESCELAVELALAQLDGTVRPTVELLPPHYLDLGSVADWSA